MRLQVVTQDSELGTYFCDQLRYMPLANMDPSLALGFYCSGAGGHRPRMTASKLPAAWALLRSPPMGVRIIGLPDWLLVGLAQKHLRDRAAESDAAGCGCADDFADLCHRLSTLEKQSGGAPLLCVVEGQGEPVWETSLDTPMSSTHGSPSAQRGGDWEFL